MRPPRASGTGLPAPDTAIFRDAAVAIADQLAKTAIWDGEHATWLGYDVEEDGDDWRSVYCNVNESLYSGLAGIGLFLIRIWQDTQDPAHARAAAGAAREATRLLHENRGVSGHGWYNGLLGALWGIGEVTAHAPDRMAPASDALWQEVLSAPNPDPAVFDLIDGAAGTLTGMLALAPPDRSAETQEACRALADWLVEMARAGPGVGLSWPEPDQSPDTYPACGLGHGASAVAVALAEAGSVLEEQRYIHVALEALRYERQWFDRKAGGWPDLRDAAAFRQGKTADLAYPLYWCYGAAGIGLARLRIWHLTGDMTARAEANAALFTCKMRARQIIEAGIAEDDFDANASVCHGLGSTLELLLYAHGLGCDRQALPLARRLGAVLCRRASAEWPCGVLGGGEAPGLMLGLSGIGTLMLALHDPQRDHLIGLPPAARHT